MPRKPAWAVPARRRAPAAAHQGPRGAHRRHVAGGLPRAPARGAAPAAACTSGPHAWLSDEWFSPDNTPGIAIPFYLAHPRLMRLERRQILEVEGGTASECLRILRHETGHVVQHAYRLSPPPPLAAALRPLLDPLSALLPAEPVEPQLRPASAPVVRAEPPRRGFRRDLRRVAEPALQLAQALPGMAGAEEAQLRRRADARDRRRQAGAHPPSRRRSGQPARQHSGGILPPQADRRIWSTRRRPTTATCAGCSPTGPRMPTPPPPPPSCVIIAPGSGRSLRAGPASTS